MCGCREQEVVRGLCGGEGGLVGTQQSRYLVMGTPFLLNEMIAGRVPELRRGLHSLWLPSWSPETPGWGSRLMCKECLVRGRERWRRDGGGEVGKRGQRGAEVQPSVGSGDLGQDAEDARERKPGAERMVETARRKRKRRAGSRGRGRTEWASVHRRGWRREARKRGEACTEPG